jgi:hypothetical protein
MSEEIEETRGMLTLTGDVFILNDFVYWRRIRTNFTTKKNYGITQTSRDEFIRIRYKECPIDFELPDGSFSELIN